MSFVTDALAAFSVPTRAVEPETVPVMARAIVLAMMADGKIVPEEETVARVYGQRLPGLSALDDEARARAIADAHAALAAEGADASLRWLAERLDAPRRHLAYCIAAAVVIADRVIDAREQQFLEELAAALAIARADADELFAGVGRILQIQAAVAVEARDWHTRAADAAKALDAGDPAAVATYKDALELAEAALGKDHAELLPILAGLGDALAAASDWGAFVDVQRRRMALAAQAHGNDSLEVADALMALGAGLEETGNYELPARVYATALGLRRAKLGTDHADVADASLALGWTYKQLGRFADARSLLQVACALRMRILGDDHPDVADALGKLADLLDATGEADQAIGLRERALEIRKKLLGELQTEPRTPDEEAAEEEQLLSEELAGLDRAGKGESPKAAEAARHYGIWLLSHGRVADAVPYFARSLAVEERLLGAENPNLARRLEELAMAQQQAGQLAAVVTSRRRILALREAQLGESSPELLATLQQLALALVFVGEDGQAVEHLERALSLEVSSPLATVLRVVCAILLVSALTELGEYERAADRSGRLGEMIDALGAEGPQKLLGDAIRAQALRRTGRLAEAAELLERVAAVATGDALGSLRAMLAIIYRRVGDVRANESLIAARAAWWAREPVDESIAATEAQATQLLEARERVLGPDHPLVATSLANAAEQRALLGRLDEADAMLARAAAIREASGGATLELAEILEARAVLAFRRGQDAEAEALLARALAIPFVPPRRATAEELDDWQRLLKAGNEALKAGDLPTADDALGRARDAAEKIGLPDARRAFVANQLARVRLGQLRLAEAETLFRAAIELGERAHGRASAEIGPYVLNLALALDGDARAGERELLYERAGQLMGGGGAIERNLALRAWTSLGVVRVKLDKPELAKVAFARAFAVEESLDEPDPIVAAQAHEQQALLLAKEQNLAGALAHTERMQLLRERVPAQFSTAHADGAVLLIGLQLGLDRTSSADATLDRILTLAEKEPAMRASLRSLFLAATTIMTPSQFLRGHVDDAERTSARVVALLSPAIDTEHAQLRAFAALYRAGLLVALGRDADARAAMPDVEPLWAADDMTRLTASMFEAATAGFLRSAGEDAGPRWRAIVAGAYQLAGREPSIERDPNLTMANAYHEAGTLWSGVGAHNEAKEQLQKALACREQSLGGDHALVGATCAALAAEHVALEEWADAAPLFARAVAIREKLVPDDEQLPALRRAAEEADEKARLALN